MNNIKKTQKDIEELLLNTQKKWTNYLASESKEDIKILLFQEFKDTAKEILPFIAKALKSERNLEDYKLLDREWGKGKSEYDIECDYLGAWFTLKTYLEEWEKNLEVKKEQKTLNNQLEQTSQDYQEIYEELVENKEQIKDLEQEVAETELEKQKQQEKINTLTTNLTENEKAKLEKKKAELQKKLDSQPENDKKKLKNEEPELDISEYSKKFDRFYEFEKNQKNNN